MTDQPSTNETAARMLAAHMEQAGGKLNAFLEENGMGAAVFARACEQLARSLPELPEGTRCQPGCAWCCHLRVGVSIPEVLVIFETLKARATPEGIAFFRRQVRETGQKGDVLSEEFWHESGQPCPFLAVKDGHCLIYDIRPFSCRAFHSTDMEICRNGFEQKKQVDVPCFPLYRSMANGYAALLIRAASQKGLASFQVGFVRAMDIMFQNEKAGARWLGGQDVFAPARI